MTDLFDKIIEKGAFPENETKVVIKQILDIVTYLHQNNITHRDIKPESFLCYGDGQDTIVKLWGFELAAQGSDKMSECSGTPGYVAPEVLQQSEPYTNTVDMWSVGVVTYILLVGFPPFFDQSDPALFKKIINVEYNFDDDSWRGVSDEAKDFIKKLLVKNPTERLTPEQAKAHAWLL